MIPYGRQDITQADIEAVVGVLRSDFLTQGSGVSTFEQAVATRVKATHAIAVNSATSALHIACLALEVGPGDVLWTVPNTFVASANCILYVGAKPVFVDIDPKTLNIDLSKVSRIDSAGLGMLMRCYTHAVRNAGILKLLNPTTQVKKVLSITRIDSVVPTFEDENAALKSF